MATELQKKAAKAAVENGGIISTAMIKAGYSPKTAKTPQKLTESDGWKELMSEYLSDNLIAKKHNQILNSKKEEIVVKGIDMAYKLKGRYEVEPESPNKKTVVAIQVIINGDNPRAENGAL
jgi:hypothetical protein